MIVAAAVLCAAGAVATVLTRRSVRQSVEWRATVTPLASIIGSGFLVVTPLLAGVVGSWAAVAMVGISILAYWVGSAIRFVIVEVEPLLEKEADAPRVLPDLERLTRLLLGFAYVISVAFYVRLMASFVLRAFGGSDLAAQLITTAVLGGIGVLGWLRGLHGLETLEEIAVGVKLAIIGGLLVGLLVFDLRTPAALFDAYDFGALPADGWTSIRVLAGTLMVVQGFETSRYLGAEYDAATRVRSMRAAQLLSGAIYVIFVALSVRLFDALPGAVDETATLDLAREVTPILVPLLVLAAVGSQLSAAVADTAGGGEMITGAARGVPEAGIGFVAVSGAAIVVVWLVDVFAIISLASRAFAAYYFVETVMVLIVLVRDREVAHRWPRLASYSLLLLVLGFITVAAIPAG